MINDDVRPYVRAAIHWLTNKDFTRATTALNHVNKILDEQENK